MARTQGDDGSPLSRAIARTGGRPVKIIDFPGLAGTKVAIWCPNELEESSADIASRQRLTGQFKLTALDLSLAQETELAKREREIELLTLVLRDPANPEMAFCEESDELREALAGPQRAALIESIEDFKIERFQSQAPGDDDDLVKAVRAMGKVDGVLPVWLTSCDSSTLRRIVRCLAASTPPTPDNYSTT